MTYPSLLVIHGQLLHTIQRGNNRQTTFTADAIGHCSSGTLVVGGGLYLCYLLYWWSFCLVSYLSVDARPYDLKKKREFSQVAGRH